MTEAVIFRQPTSCDSRNMRLIAQDTQVLSVNSTYYYALMARHFKSTCLVAEIKGEVCGYITGYCPPHQPDTIFIWQVGLAKKMQGQGLGKKMLISFLKEKKPDFLEATIAPNNLPSINLFKSAAHYFKAEYDFSEKPFFREEELSEDDEPEHLMRIGPIKLKKE